MERRKIANAALGDGIVGPDRSDPPVQNIDPGRQPCIGRKDIDHIPADGHLAGLIDTVIGKIADVLENIGKLLDKDRIPRRQTWQRAAEGFGWGIAPRSRFAAQDASEGAAIRRLLEEAQPAECGNAGANIGWRGGSDIPRESITRWQKEDRGVGPKGLQRRGQSFGLLVIIGEVDYVLCLDKVSDLRGGPGGTRHA
ncbi:hypothetical protein ACFB49_06230 [Sphingomonas sp. DBB INV C78]